jgi:peptidylprolyl isomerase
MRKWLIAMIVGCTLAAACDKQADEPQEPAEQTQPATDEPETTPPTTEATDEPAEDPYAPPENVAGPPEDAQKTDSGLAYVILEAGTGDKPTATSEVTIDYTGWTTDGKMFDSSHKRGEPATFPLSNLIKGWQEGVPMMKKGATWRFWVPAELAYKDSPRPDAPQGMLVFDIHLIDFD